MADERTDFLGELTDELALKVLDCCDGRGLSSSAQVSRQWRALAERPELWSRQYTRRFATAVPAPGGKALDASRPLPWQRLYGWRSGVDRQWRRGEPTAQACGEAHVAWVNAVRINRAHGVVLSGGADGRCVLWSPKGAMLRSLDTHLGAAAALAHAGGALGVLGSAGARSDCVWCVDTAGGVAVAGTTEGRALLWDMETGARIGASAGAAPFSASSPRGGGGGGQWAAAAAAVGVRGGGAEAATGLEELATGCVTSAQLLGPGQALVLTSHSNGTALIRDRRAGGGVALAVHVSGEPGTAYSPESVAELMSQPWGAVSQRLYCARVSHVSHDPSPGSSACYNPTSDSSGSHSRGGGGVNIGGGSGGGGMVGGGSIGGGGVGAAAFLAGCKGAVHAYDLRVPAKIAVVHPHADDVFALDLEGGRLASGSFDGTVALLDASAIVRMASPSPSSSSSSAFNINTSGSGGGNNGSASDDHAIISTLPELGFGHTHRQPVFGLRLAPDWRFATASEDGSVCIWDAGTAPNFAGASSASVVAPWPPLGAAAAGGRSAAAAAVGEEYGGDVDGRGSGPGSPSGSSGGGGGGGGDNGSGLPTTSMLRGGELPLVGRFVPSQFAEPRLGPGDEDYHPHMVAARGAAVHGMDFADDLLVTVGRDAMVRFHRMGAKWRS